MKKSVLQISLFSNELKFLEQFIDSRNKETLDIMIIQKILVESSKHELYQIKISIVSPTHKMNILGAFLIGHTVGRV
jgi:capsular polysaccharide biosynthesis protein